MQRSLVRVGWYEQWVFTLSNRINIKTRLFFV
jgi:hypothetical protein